MAIFARGIEELAAGEREPSGAVVRSPADRLRSTLEAQLRNAVDAVASDLLTYESLRNVSEVIGGEYGDRVVFELFQNGHDAHPADGDGAILLRLVVHAPDRGDLYVANKGRGFRWEDVRAVRNIGVSSKSVGEGIGNKGLGFRSVETLTEDPRIYSQRRAVPADRFDGYCFRFASPDEVRRETLAIADEGTAARVASVLPRYLASVPMEEQPEEIRRLARAGFATVVHLPLSRADAVAVAREQVTAIAGVDAPLLLFLDRLAEVTIEVEDGVALTRKLLTRSVLGRPILEAGSPLDCEVVAIGPGASRYLVVRRRIDRGRLLDAVEASVAKEPRLVRWRDWRGDPTVAVAVSLSSGDVERGRTYNFLPMAEEVPSPVRGHVDAPFYASIDRRRANFDLPLNSFLLDELAETTLRAAVALKPLSGELGRGAVFDLAAWSSSDVSRLARASARIGFDWRDHALVPASGGPDEWATFREARTWHEQGYRQLRVRGLVRAGIRAIADPDLGPPRLDRLRHLQLTMGVRSAPDERTLAAWVEAVALSMDGDGASPRAWANLYDEARRALAPSHGLRSLAGRAVLKTRDGIRPAMGVPGVAPTFVREAGSGSRDVGRAPLPPASLSSKFAFFDDAVAMSPEVLADFLKAGLIRRYDALETLGSVQALFGDKPAPRRRETILKWAFGVWRAEGQRSEGILRDVDLHVETVGGWRPASCARFSGGWTTEGRTLSTYLAEAAPLSSDCARAAEALLPPEPAWAPRTDGGGRRRWVEFLRAAGVRDGLPIIDDADAPSSGTPADTWIAFRRTPVPAVGRSTAWARAASEASLPNPYTNYARRGGLWRFPGQVEHEALPPEARRRLAELVMVHLAQQDQGWLTWRLGRYERWRDDQNEREMPTPAATFVAAEPWMPVEGDPGRFERPADIWSSSDRRRRPPRWVDRLPERLSDLVEEDGRLSSALFKPSVGLLDWSVPGEAVRRLAALARGSSRLEPRERVNFRRAYEAAWAEVCEADVALPGTLPVVVATPLGPTMVEGCPTGRTRVFVTGDALSPETKAVVAAGQPVLDVGDPRLVPCALERLNASGGFEATGIDTRQVDVLVDGAAMVPNLSDPLLASDGLEWLSEAAVLANEVLGRELERQISGAAIGQRLRRVRLRRCGTIRLAVAGAPVDEDLPFFAFPDDDLPTLVVGEGQEITWSVLADAAPHLATLLDRRMRSLETLMLRLAHRVADPDPRRRPTDDELARALGCKVELVREHALALRADGDALMRRLLPLVACATDLRTAREMGLALGEAPSRARVSEALDGVADRLPVLPAAFLDELGRTDLAEVRRRLGLDYGTLNSMLEAFGQPMLSNEAELRRRFAFWKGELAPAAIERLRRRFRRDFDAGTSLDRYVELRALDFVAFDEGWVATREDLPREVVATMIEARLEELLGSDADVELAPIEQVRASTGRALQRLVDANAPTMAAWCSRNDHDDPWAGGAMAVLKAVDRRGLMDFAAMELGREVTCLARAGCWPSGMPQTLEPASLGLDPGDLLDASERERRRRADEEVARRSIDFGKDSLDTRADDFARRLVELADAGMLDGTWLTRSRRRFALRPQSEPKGRGGGPGGVGGKGKGAERLTEHERSAMGFAGEYLASRFLREKHRERYAERCWVSGNRARLEIDWEGDDTLGFDFRVRTAEVEWRYEVKANRGEGFEFEFTRNEMRSAAECAADGSRRYRILYVPFVFEPSRWRVMELPNPMTERGRLLFRVIGTGSTRFRFEPS